MIQDLYKGVEVEPTEPNLIEKIHLRARVIDDAHFVFIPEFWEQALKPYKKANWKHETGHEGSGFVPYDYQLKRGNYIVFLQSPLDGGFYIARLYMVINAMEQGEQARGEFTKNELIIERLLEGKVYHRVILKTNPLGGVDNIYHAVLG